jgi:hypothetical protein
MDGGTRRMPWSKASRNLPQRQRLPFSGRAGHRRVNTIRRVLSRLAVMRITPVGSREGVWVIAVVGDGERRRRVDVLPVHRLGHSV